MNVPLENYFEALRQEIETAFAREGQAGDMPHAFLPVGYASLRRGGPVHRP